MTNNVHTHYAIILLKCEVNGDFLGQLKFWTSTNRVNARKSIYVTLKVHLRLVCPLDRSVFWIKLSRHNVFLSIGQTVWSPFETQNNTVESLCDGLYSALLSKSITMSLPSYHKKNLLFTKLVFTYLKLCNVKIADSITILYFRLTTTEFGKLFTEKINL